MFSLTPFFTFMTMFFSDTFFVFMIIFPFTCKTQNAADRFSYHPLLVRVNDADGDPAGRRGNHPRVRHVSFFFEFDSKESQPIADPGPDYGRILADAASEHQRV